MEEILKEILEKENIKFTRFEKTKSGFTNLVYFVDNKFVIKLSSDDKQKKKLEKEISIYKNLNLSFIPRLVASGSYKDFTYLIISKINGKGLFSIWHTLNENERQNIINKIANILKQFNSQSGEFLDEEYKIQNWPWYIKEQLSKKSEALKNLGFDTRDIDNFINNDVDDLFANNTFGLVYNDSHFDNFIYNNGKLSLIDFDRVVYCPIDYEMLIFKTMCDNPAKFANEEDEEKVNLNDYKKNYSQFKQNYPKMFADSRVEQRIFIYQFNYCLGQAIDCENLSRIESLINEFQKKLKI